MSLTVNAGTYNADGYGANAVAYIGAAKTSSEKDDLVLRRTAPKPTSTFSGVARTQAKLTRTKTLTGSLTPKGDLIADCGFSLPVGIAAADIDGLCDDLGAFIASAAFKTHLKSQKISF